MNFKLLPLLLLLTSAPMFAQPSLPVKWEELTAGDFVKAIQKAQNTCLSLRHHREAWATPSFGGRI